MFSGSVYRYLKTFKKDQNELLHPHSAYSKPSPVSSSLRGDAGVGTNLHAPQGV